MNFSLNKKQKNTFMLYSLYLFLNLMFLVLLWDIFLILADRKQQLANFSMRKVLLLAIIPVSNTETKYNTISNSLRTHTDFTKSINELTSLYHLDGMKFEYFKIFVMFIIILFVSFLLFTIAYFLSLTTIKDSEKLSQYECGFQPFDEATRHPFDIHFYVVGILFLIFDVEIALLFPWVFGLSKLTAFNFYSMLIFLFLLTVGFFYEWHRGALIWPHKQKL